MQTVSKVSTILRLMAVRKLMAIHGRWLDAAGLPNIACFPRDWIGRAIVVDGLHERELLEALGSNLFSQSDQWRDAVALDIGANIGNHALYFAQYFGTVLAFEPNPLTLNLLRANLMANSAANVRVMEVGLGAENAMLPFELPEGNLGEAKIVTRASSSAKQELPIRVGDEVLAAELPEGSRVVFIKIDVEGHELYALKGLAGTLSRHRPVVAFESNHASGEDGGSVVVDYLKSCGYEYFYSVESRTLFPEVIRTRLVKLIEKLIIGHSKIFTPLPILQNRFYALVLASPVPLRET